jgi:tRNA (adenine37-N6)-methyltransferase
VVFEFHLVDPAEVQWGAHRPRGNPDWPEVGMFAQRAKMRPNRLGVSTCRLTAVEGLDLHVQGLDADVRQPAWSTELMRGYY